jgi:ATP-dependent protease ClpP protease subunit
MRLLLNAILAFAIAFVLAVGLATIANAEPIVLTTQNTVVFRGVVTDSAVVQAQLEIYNLQQRRGLKNYPIYLVFDSPGGSIDAGLSFIEGVKLTPNLKTITIFGASMASAIAQALPGSRLLTANGTMMFHRAQGSFRGYFEKGEVESQLEVSKAMVRSMEQTNASRLRMSLADYKSLVVNELWLFGSNNLTYRAADSIVDIVCTRELINKKVTSKEDNVFAMLFGGGGEVTFSGCPLLRAPLVTSGDVVKYLIPNVENYATITKKLSDEKSIRGLY